jgi:hypothetical protein
MTGHWRDLRELKKRRIVAVATIKEFFGMATNYLVLFASTTGIVGIVQALFAVEAVGVFVLSGVLSHLGIIAESLDRDDVIQKSVGVIFVGAATWLLFL